ncbi:hypothetical protein DMN91_012987 [Ooceraea biroi]|uniref:ascorbate ferrireductase (transmembrane) n=2 Tax=Ooceraea biroi TaxID=2015173 RepID=A0A3L8D4C8_OOCBI|nr:cytochrome b561 domain-containing protein 2-like [Ooceraea biroi]RLU15099.1 hypothetical protein DMN91_012986 [Ooceraea biroi]RLU15100.1 hypothetical protein DMN91_012987 [Ooceraea biroi]
MRNNTSRGCFWSYTIYNGKLCVHYTHPADAIKFSSGNPRNSNYNLHLALRVPFRVESRIERRLSPLLFTRKFSPSKMAKELPTTQPTGNFSTVVHESISSFQYVLLMSEAVVVLAGDNVLTRCLSRQASKHLHWILQAIGLIFNLIGVGLMYDAKRNHNHFQSIHAITGLSSLVIVCVVTIFGYPVWIAWKLRKLVRPVTVKLLHNFLGTAGFVIGMVSQCYGYKKNWLHYVTGVEHSDMVALVLTALITILSLRSALVSLGRQVVAALN